MRVAWPQILIPYTHQLFAKPIWKNVTAKKQISYFFGKCAPDPAQCVQIKKYGFLMTFWGAPSHHTKFQPNRWRATTALLDILEKPLLSFNSLTLLSCQALQLLLFSCKSCFLKLKYTATTFDWIPGPPAPGESAATRLVTGRGRLAGAPASDGRVAVRGLA